MFRFHKLPFRSSTGCQTKTEVKRWFFFLMLHCTMGKNQSGEHCGMFRDYNVRVLLVLLFITTCHIHFVAGVTSGIYRRRLQIAASPTEGWVLLLVLFVVWLFLFCFLVWQFTDRFTSRCSQKWYWILFDVNFPVAVSLPYVYVGVGDYYAVLHTLFCKQLAQCRSCRWCSVTWDHRTALDHRKVSRS